MSETYDILLPPVPVSPTATFPSLRLRRLRQHPALRNLVRETRLSLEEMVLPLFIKEGKNIKTPIGAIPGHYQLSIDQLDQEIEEILQLKISAILLFGIPGNKDTMGSDALSEEGIIQKAIRKIKKLAPELLVITDLCFCGYTDHGHCGVMNEKFNDVDNDKTLELLAKQAISHVAAGADVVAPSGMMDGMVQAIRQGLDRAGFSHIPILSYSIKYASAFYGAFREAAQSSPKFGNRQTYQADPANGDIAFREAELDVMEGADMLMVKPAQMYLDVIYRIKKKFPGIPLAAYQVGSEYAMLKAGAEKGWLDEEKAMLESLTAIKRAGANFIIHYFVKDFARFIQKSR